MRIFKVNLHPFLGYSPFIQNDIRLKRLIYKQKDVYYICVKPEKKNM